MSTDTVEILWNSWFHIVEFTLKYCGNPDSTVWNLCGIYEEILWKSWFHIVEFTWKYCGNPDSTVWNLCGTYEGKTKF